MKISMSYTNTQKIPNSKWSTVGLHLVDIRGMSFISVFTVCDEKKFFLAVIKYGLVYNLLQQNTQ